MSNVLDFESYKVQKEIKNDFAPEMFAKINEILEDWRNEQEKLDDFINRILCTKNKKYTSDLNLTSYLEHSLGIKQLSVHAPGCTEGNLNGWIAAFSIEGLDEYLDGDSILFTTPEMSSENLARLLCIVVHHSIKDLMKNNPLTRNLDK